MPGTLKKRPSGKKTKTDDIDSLMLAHAPVRSHCKNRCRIDGIVRFLQGVSRFDSKSKEATSMNCSHDSLKGPKSSHQELLEKKRRLCRALLQSVCLIERCAGNAPVQCFFSLRCRQRELSGIQRIVRSSSFCPSLSKIAAHFRSFMV